MLNRFSGKYGLATSRVLQKLQIVRDPYITDAIQSDISKRSICLQKLDLEKGAPFAAFLSASIT